MKALGDISRILVRTYPFCSRAIYRVHGQASLGIPGRHTLFQKSMTESREGARVLSILRLGRYHILRLPFVGLGQSTCLEM